MPELKAIFTGDAKPFEKELRTVEALSARTAKNIERSFAGSATGGHSGSSGIIREMVVLAREISAGNVTKVPGSLSILLQRMGLLQYIFKDGATAAQVLAQGYAELAQKSTVAAIAATQKAAATQAAFYADGEESEASLAAAVASEQEAVAARAAAAALTQKAEAATASAAANTEAAATGIGAVGVIGGIVLGIIAGTFAAYKLASSLTEKLSGVKLPDFHPEYIAKHLQKVNQIAEGQKEINREIEKQVDSYHSVAAAAERVADATKKHFEHARKINEYNKEAELARAKTPAEKKAINEKYDQKDSALRNEERQQEVSNKFNESANLKIQGDAKQAAANRISVNSKQEDEQIIAKNKANAEAAQKAYEDLQEQKDTSGNILPTGRAVVRGYNAVANTGVSTEDLNAAEKKIQQDAFDFRKKYEASVERSTANDELRKKKSDLTKEAGQSLGKSETVKLEASSLTEANKQASKDDAEEQKAKTAAEDAKLDRTHAKSSNVTEREKIGLGFTGGVTADLLSVAKRSEGHLKAIASNTKGGKTGTSPDPLGGF